MLLEELLIQKKEKDILEYSGIEISTNYLSEKYYVDGINKLEINDYFISDLDGTFFRGMLSKETFSHFIKYIRKQNFLSFDKNIFKSFLDDIFVFNELEKKAYNKEIAYSEYIDAGTFLMFKYRDMINFDKFLIYLENSLTNKRKINPFRFSINKMKEILNENKGFLFVSGAPHFALDIYIKSLKKYLEHNLGIKNTQNIYGFGSYINIYSSNSVLLFGKDHKNSFIKLLSESGKIKRIIGGMGDSTRDFGISFNLENNSDFYFVNPEEKVIKKFEDLKNNKIYYHFIFERKDLIFSTDINNINIIK